MERLLLEPHQQQLWGAAAAAAAAGAAAKRVQAVAAGSSAAAAAAVQEGSGCKQGAVTHYNPTVRRWVAAAVEAWEQLCYVTSNCDRGTVGKIPASAWQI